MNVEELRKRNILRREYAAMESNALSKLVMSNYAQKEIPERFREMNEALDTLMWRLDPENGNPSPNEWAAVLGITGRHLDCEGLAQFNGMFTRQLGGIYQMLACQNGETELASAEEVLDRESSGFWYPAACS